MVAVLRRGTTLAQRENLIHWFEDMGLKVHVSEGDYQCILGLIGDTWKDCRLLKA